MSIEDDLRGHFTDQEWEMVQDYEVNGSSRDQIAERQGLPYALADGVVRRWRTLVTEWEIANWSRP